MSNVYYKSWPVQCNAIIDIQYKWYWYSAMTNGDMQCNILLVVMCNDILWYIDANDIIIVLLLIYYSILSVFCAINVCVQCVMIMQY